MHGLTTVDLHKRTKQTKPRLCLGQLDLLICFSSLSLFPWFGYLSEGKKGLSSETAPSAVPEIVDHCKEVKWGMPGRPECNSNGFLFNHRPTQQKD